jgi:hypothetical protein
MPLVSAREYARRRGVSEGAVRKRLDHHGGPIPTHGPKRLVDVAEADRLWAATMAPNGYATSRFRSPAPTGDGPEAAGRAAPPRGGLMDGHELAQARAAALVLDVQTKRLNLEQRRGQLISRDRAVLRCFAFARLLRDAWLTWPARVGPGLAAQFDVDATAFTVALQEQVREQLATLARERPEF